MAAAAIGGGGGYSLGLISDSLAAHAPPQGATVMGDREMRVEDVAGEARILAPDGTWLTVRSGDPLSPPSCIEANGPLSTFRAKLGRAQISAGHDARVLISENAGALQLDRGHVKVTGAWMSTHVPLHRMKVAGTSYGIWAEENRVIIAVIEGEVEVTSNGEPIKYAGGREIVYRGKTITPQALAKELTIQVTDEQQRGSERRITAIVPPASIVMKKTAEGYERVDVPGSGKIAVTLAGREPSPGELVAFDAAGRSAHLGGTPEAVKAALSGESKAIEPKTIEPPPAAPPPPKPEKKERKRKRRGPKPLEKPEAKPPPLEDDDLPPVEETPLPPERSEDEEDPTLREIEEVQEDEEKVD
jgi:hypothetical protein